MVLRNHITDNVTIIILRLLCEYISIDRMSNWGFFSFITSNVLDHHNFQYGKKVGRDFSKKNLKHVFLNLTGMINTKSLNMMHTYTYDNYNSNTHTHTHTHTFILPKVSIEHDKTMEPEEPI